jgi:hypothetical protein
VVMSVMPAANQRRDRASITCEVGAARHGGR